MLLHVQNEFIHKIYTAQENMIFMYIRVLKMGAIA